MFKGRVTSTSRRMTSQCWLTDEIKVREAFAAATLRVLKPSLASPQKHDASRSKSTRRSSRDVLALSGFAVVGEKRESRRAAQSNTFPQLQRILSFGNQFDARPAS